MSIDNSNGGILAMVGGRDFGHSPYNRAIRAARQAGSTFKPFIYAVGFDRGGLLPGSYVSDDELRLPGGNGKIWSPKNSDGRFTGLQPAAIGLIKSRNTMSVRVGQAAGMNNITSLARALKFGDIPDSLVSCLGAFDTTLSTMTSAYSTLATEGVNRNPHIIRRITNTKGRELYSQPLGASMVFRPSVAWMTADIMGKTMDEGTGRGARTAGYKAPAYGKTGTTNDYKDAWFVGFTDKVTTGVWVGMDKPQTIMSRGYGSTLALPIWTEVMKKAETVGFKAEKLPEPKNMKEMLICRECNGVKNNRTVNFYQMRIPADMAPRRGCVGHRTLLTRKPKPPTSVVGGNQTRQPTSRPNTGEGLGGAIRNLGRWLFGPKKN